MKSAADWFEEGLAALELSRTADHHSEYVGDLETALTAFDRTLALEPSHPRAAAQRGLSLARLGRHAEAVEALASALRLTPADAELLLAQAQSLQQMSALDDALRAYEDVLRSRPDDSEALFGRAEALESLRRHDDAFDAWNAVLGLPDNRTLTLSGQTMRVTTSDFRRIRAWVSRASALAHLGRTQESVEAFREIFASAWYELHGPLQQHHLIRAIQEVESARIAYRRHLEESGEDAIMWRVAGRMWLAAGFVEESLTACSESIRLAPNDGDAWWCLGEAFAKAGRLQEAVHAMREAQKRNPVAYLAVAARLKVLEKEFARNGSLRWTLMGRDTFAREDYVVGEYDTAEEAELRLSEREKAVEQTQDESLRDTFWIIPPDSRSKHPSHNGISD